MRSPLKKGRCYRYYVSAAPVGAAARDRSDNWRIAAQEIEECVVRILIDALTTPARLLEQLGNPDMPSGHLRRLLRRAARFAATLRNSSGQRPKVIRERRAGDRRRGENGRRYAAECPIGWRSAAGRVRSER